MRSLHASAVDNIPTKRISLIKRFSLNKVIFLIKNNKATATTDNDCH